MDEGGFEPQVVPFFPLNIVLFPGMELPLHIFESRYQLLVERTLERDGRLALGLLRDASDAEGPPPEAFSTVTLAQIDQIARFKDGRMNIVVTGKLRCRVRDLIDDEPFRQARIEAIPESRDPVPAEVMARAAELYRSYVEILVALSAIPLVQSLPDDPQEASYLIARTLQTDLFTKQSLLEAAGPHARLVSEVQLLERDVERLRAFAQINTDLGYFFYRGNRLSMN